MFAFKFCRECDSPIDCVGGVLCSYGCKYDGVEYHERPKGTIVVKFYAFHHEEEWDGND